MKKKDIKRFFKAVSNDDLHEVSELVNQDREYVTVCNMAPPKKDDGQSGLQVAFKRGSFDVARFLIEKGADINFMETSEINEWMAPVLHDSIRATIFNSYTLEKDLRKFEKSFVLLQLMLNNGADPNSTDSYGNNCLHRAIMDARQMIDNPSADMASGILIQQLKKVFNALILVGADVHLENEKRPSAEKMLKNFRLEEYQLW